MATRRKRVYASPKRDEAAAATRSRVLDAAKTLFARRGIDAVTIAQIAERAGVSGSLVYALFKSKEGLLRALIQEALFGQGYKAASAQLDAEADPVARIRMTASVARSIYEGEAAELGLLRGASSFSPALRRLEATLEEKRFALQEARVLRLFEAGKAREGLSIEKARRLLWMYTSRDIYRLLVLEGGFTPDEYEAWLAQTLLTALVAPPPGHSGP
jgi:AcrR family transcriptional regulator